jgi:hypothetical protein
MLFKAIVGSIMTCLMLTIPAWLLQRLTEIPFASHRLEAMIVLAAFAVYFLVATPIAVYVGASRAGFCPRITAATFAKGKGAKERGS